MAGKESVERVKTDLEIEEHLPMHERGWKVQAVGMYLIVALVFTAAVGLYGDGVISKRRAGEDIATVEYQRFYRFQARMELKVELNVPEGGDEVIVSFPGKYLESFQVDSVLPEPEKNVLNSDQVEYHFNGTGRSTITFYLIPQSIGAIDGSIQVNNSRFELNHFIFP
jgi:hypothetical protein